MQDLGDRRPRGAKNKSGGAGGAGSGGPQRPPPAAVRDMVNPIRELFDAAAHGYTLKLVCRGCARAQVFHAAAVWRHFQRKSWSPWLRDVGQHFRCRRCGRRGPRLELSHDEPTDTHLPLPDVYAWKRELSRRR
jgi:hypothetical protein